MPKTSANPENCNYYFNWNTLLTRSGINDLNHSTGDPCSLVYPAGKWKTPSEDDFNLLLTSANVNFSNEGTGAIKFQNTITGNTVIFHQAGWLFGLGCTVSNTTDGQYWTSSTSPLGVLGRIFEIGNESAGPRAGFDSEAKSVGASIRCIRN